MSLAEKSERLAGPLDGSPLSDRQFASIAKALADPRRFGILREIAGSDAPLPCCSLSDSAKVSAATISHHIRELELAGLIVIQRDGKFARLVFQRTTFDAYISRLTQSLNHPSRTGSPSQ